MPDSKEGRGTVYSSSTLVTSFFFQGRRDRPSGLSVSDRSKDLSLHLLLGHCEAHSAEAISGKGVNYEIASRSLP